MVCKEKAKDSKDLVEIDFLLVYFNQSRFGFSSKVDKISLVELESRKRKILLDREQEARQKSRALWLLCGDDNTPFFHKFSNYRKIVNTIWKIANDEGNLDEGSESIAKEGVQHFESLFQEVKNLYLLEVVMSASFFSTSISEDDNEELMKVITMQELKSFLT